MGPHPRGLPGLGRLLPGDWPWNMGHKAGQDLQTRPEGRVLPPSPGLFSQQGGWGEGGCSHSGPSATSTASVRGATSAHGHPLPWFWLLSEMLRDLQHTFIGHLTRASLCIEFWANKIKYKAFPEGLPGCEGARAANRCVMVQA